MPGNLRNRIANFVFAWPRAWRRRAVKPGSVVYYPAFSSEPELTNHYHRACWYLPSVPNVLSTVTMHQIFSDARQPIGPRPACMATDGHSGAHIAIRKSGTFAALRGLWNAHVILAWKTPRGAPALWLMKLFGATIVNVTTDDPTAREYGAYCKIIWAHLLSRGEREAIVEENRRRFAECASRIRATNPAQACVLGNGPTLEFAHAFDFTRTLTILCNTTVGDDAIVARTKPAFVCASDVVSHLGVSAAAGEFRRMLLAAMKRHDFTFVTTAAFGYLLTLHFSQHRDRIILVDQSSADPVYDLTAQFAAPQLDSVMNILMLPLAATICDDIWLLGADGKSTTRDNEDFWAHATTAGNDAALVQAGHTCHPTFDLHRRQTTYNRYNESIERTVTEGESHHGKRYRCLFPSNTPALASRAIPEAWRAECRPESPCSLVALTARAKESQSR